jgi:hypothetical protein
VVKAQGSRSQPAPSHLRQLRSSHQFGCCISLTTYVSNRKKVLNIHRLGTSQSESETSSPSSPVPSSPTTIAEVCKTSGWYGIRRFADSLARMSRANRWLLKALLLGSSWTHMLLELAGQGVAQGALSEAHPKSHLKLRVKAALLTL